MTTMIRRRRVVPGVILMGSVVPLLLLLLAVTTTTTATAAATPMVNILALKNGRESQCQGLWAKEGSLIVGNVCVEPDRHNPEQLMVSFTSSNGWELDEVEFWMGRNLTTELPMTTTSTTKTTTTTVTTTTAAMNNLIQQEAKEEQEKEQEETSDNSQPSVSFEDGVPDLSKFPFTKLDLNGKYTHYGFIIKVWNLNYGCPDPRGTAFAGVAHATVLSRTNLRNVKIPATRAQAWAGLPPQIADRDHQDDPKDDETENTGSAAATTATPRKDNWLDFAFTLVCDSVPRRAEDAPERHRANLVPS